MPPAPQPHTSWQCAHQAQAMATTDFCHLHFLVISCCWNNTKWFPLCVLMCMIHVCIVYLYGMCMHALMCECGYPCVEFRGRLGCWPLASASRQVLFVTHSCVRLTGWKASRMILSSHSISSMVLGAYTHVQYITWCWEHIHTQLYEDAGIHTQIFTLGQQANALLMRHLPISRMTSWSVIFFIPHFLASTLFFHLYSWIIILRFINVVICYEWFIHFYCWVKIHSMEIVYVFLDWLAFMLFPFETSFN